MKLFHKSLLVICSILFIKAQSHTTNDTIYRKKSPYRSSARRTTDIIHTKLNVSFDWSKSQLTGEAEILAKPYFYPEKNVFLDARGMEIKSLEVYAFSNQQLSGNKQPDGSVKNIKLNASYTYFNDSLRVDLGREFQPDEKFVIKIKYVARPNELKTGGSEAISDDKGLYFINPNGTDKNKIPQIWTQGETQSNSAWFPTVDNPNEKMTNEIFMTVNNKYTTLSNGVLTESKKNADGTRTDHWKMDLPHSPYLVMMAVGEFKKVTDSSWNGKEISYYVEKEYEPYAKGIFGDTKEMIDFFSKTLGTPYPWPKYSQVVVRDYVSGAMENTSATLHGDFMVYQTAREMLDGKKGEDVISHELFHQWFGDYVTAESWSNLPLNESFATYGEYLWREFKHGRDAADFHSYQSRMGYFAAAEFAEVELIRYHYHNREDMFDAFSYNKGGQVLHMLRKYVGDKAFFQSLKLYLEKNKYKNAEIHDLRLAFEEVTGEDLNWFFNQWFLSKGFPELEISKTYDAGNKQVVLKVMQKQNLQECPLYILPVDIDIYEQGKAKRTRIVINAKEQEFRFNVSSEPDLVNFDSERQLLCKYKFPKTVNEYIYQYKHAPYFGDRQDALEHLAYKVTEKEVYDLFVTAAKSDSFSELRTKALLSLDIVAPSKESELKPFLINLFQTEKNTNVKAAAILFLGQYFKGEEVEDVITRALNEQSYAIVSSALESMSHVNVKKAIASAEKLSNEKNNLILDAIAKVYVIAGNDSQLNFFHNGIQQYNGYGVMDFISQYVLFLKNCSSTTTFETSFEDLLTLSKSDNKVISSYTKKVIKENFAPLVESKTKGDKGESFKSLNEKVALAIKTMS